MESSKGSMVLPGTEQRIYAGPFKDRLPGTVGVCLLEQMSRSQGEAVHMPIRDFSVPTNTVKTRLVALFVYALVLEGRAVYVGCMGGRGRTGLFLALLAALAGSSEPVQYVRTEYSSHAVETEEQEEFVAGLFGYADWAAATALRWSSYARQALIATLSPVLLD